MNPRIHRSDLRRIAVVDSPWKPAGKAVADRVATAARRSGLEVLRQLDDATDLSAVHLVVAVGGDGTILSTARALGERQVPTLGINLGKLGFLAEFTEEDVVAWLEGRGALDLEVEPRMRLRCATLGPAGTADTIDYALNDAAVQQGVPTRLMQLDMAVDGRHATQYRADGVVVAGPVGSTAYSLSLGGPILTPDLRAIVVTPIAPHALTNRPVVVGGDHRLTFTLRTQHKDAGLVLDGHVVRPLTLGSTFEVSRAPVDFLLVTSVTNSYYSLLRSKLGWGEVPKWQEQP